MSDLNTEMRRIRRLSRLLILLTGLLMVVLAVYGWNAAKRLFGSADGSPRAITPRGELMSFEKSTIALFKNASPSVVFINTDAERFDRNLRRFDSVPEGSGSGFIWDRFGHIVTNYHVIQKAIATHVSLFDQSTYDAQVVGVDPDHDLAVVKINPPLGIDLVPVPLGTSSDLQVGQFVVAIGNPFGLDQSLTTGIVSALNRSIIGAGGAPIDDVIQTDAAINPGNSGGPLLDSSGRLIGVNTAIASPTGTYSGIGFAIPVDTANQIVPKIIKSGPRARIDGIRFSDARQLQFNRNFEGAVITYVEPGSAAQQARLTGITEIQRRGGTFVNINDVITQLNDKPIKSAADLYSALDHLHPGDTITLTVTRNNESRRVQLATQ